MYYVLKVYLSYNKHNYDSSNKSTPESGLPSMKNWHISKVFKINIPDKVKDLDEEVEEKIIQVT